MFDKQSFDLFVEKNKDKNNKIIDKVNSSIDGRVCASFWLHTLLSLKSFKGNNCKVYLEIGTLLGGSISSLLQLDDSNITSYYGIDIFEGYYGKEIKKGDWNKTSKDINGNNHLDFVKQNINKFNKVNAKCELIKGSSYDDNTVNKFKSKNVKVDILFIDGDHSEKGVTLDYHKYKEYVNNDGFILFDNYGDPNRWQGVKKGVDKIDFSTDGFSIVGQYGYSLLVHKTK